MSGFTALQTDGKLNQTIAGLLRCLLEEEVVSGVLVQARQPYRKVVMPSLITNPEDLDSVDPFAPVAPLSGAKVASSLTSKSPGRPVALVLRSCELRAFVELVKLHQASLDDVVVIGIDCLGRYENADYLRLAASDDDVTTTFLCGHGNGSPQPDDAPEIAEACKACEALLPSNVDIRLCVVGADPTKELWVEWVSDKASEICTTLGHTAADAGPAERPAALAAIEEKRTAYRGQMLDEFEARTKDLAGLADVVASCVNCYNCRNACPVCYCRECVFSTDTFRHDGEQYMRWSDKRGHVRMPADTIFYHLTRMLHVSALCVGCGQCSSACPNDIPVMEILQTAAKRTQKRFDYVPGRSLDDPQPLAFFQEDEFIEVTGGQVK